MVAKGWFCPPIPRAPLQRIRLFRLTSWSALRTGTRLQRSCASREHEEVRDYELTETDFDLLALNSVSPGIFSDITPPAILQSRQLAVPPQAIAPAPAETHRR